MKKMVVAIAATAACAIPAAASANQTVGIPGFNCSVTAYTPSYGGQYGESAAKGGVSCGGAQANYQKMINVTELQLVNPGGWQSVTGGSTGNYGWYFNNPLQLGYMIAPCVPGRWYASDVTGYVSGGGAEGGLEVTSKASGYRCP